MKTAKKTRASVAPIFLKMAAVKAQNESSRINTLSNAFKKAGSAMFVSTSAQVVTRGEDFIHDEILYVVNTAYYRLTPRFWAYLHHAFDNATRACEDGKLDGVTYEELLNRIARIYNHAIDQYGESAIKSAEQSFSPAKWKRYCERLSQRTSAGRHESDDIEPTRSYRYPENGTGAISAVLGAVIEQVDAIRDNAISLGWTMDQLYCNVGAAHRDWGLVCYLGPVDRIGAVTNQSIEIIDQRTGKSLCFYNNAVEQPWIRCTSKEAAK